MVRHSFQCNEGENWLWSNNKMAYTYKHITVWFPGLKSDLLLT